MIDIAPISKDLNQILKQQYSGGIFGESPNFIQAGKGKWFFPERYREYAEKYKKFKVRQSDVWVTGYPRSGTSVTADICWLFTHGIDFETAKNSAFNERSKLFELNTLFGDESKLIKDEKTKSVFKNLFQSLDEEPEGRVIKTHLPFELLPLDLLSCGAKIIYIIRNIKDVAVSFYNLQKTPTRENFKGTFEEFWINLENDHLTFNPYWKHVKQGLDQYTNKNVLIIFYEEEIGDIKKGIKRIAEFLEIQITDRQLNDLADFFSFQNYKKVTQGRNFFNDNFEHVRRGQAGGWKTEFPVALRERADKWKEKNIKNLNITNERLYELLLK